MIPITLSAWMHLCRAFLFVLLLGSVILLSLSLQAADATSSSPGKRFVQDRFVIGSWVPPQTSERLLERYREMAEAHFNLVIGTAGTNVEAQVAICAQHGLKVIVDTGGNLDGLPDHEACWGYHLQDEPSASVFEELAAQAELIRQRRPGRFGYINLFPNYATPAQLGSPSYEQHVREFVDRVKPEVLSMDHYPMMKPGRDSRGAYLENLEVMRRESLRVGIPFWNYFNSMPFGPHMDPTEAQLRWQIFASIAYGAKGVMYFCYWTPGKGSGGAGEFPKGGAIITAEGHPTRHYDEARRINAELKAWGPVLMQLTSVQVERIKLGKDVGAGAKWSGMGIRRIEKVESDPDPEFLVGTLRHRDGRRAVLVVNHDYAHTAWPTVELDSAWSGVKEVSKRDGSESPVRDDSPELPGVQLSLGAGDARLFLFP